MSRLVEYLKGRGFDIRGLYFEHDSRGVSYRDLVDLNDSSLLNESNVEHLEKAPVDGSLYVTATRKAFGKVDEFVFRYDATPSSWRLSGLYSNGNESEFSPKLFIQGMPVPIRQSIRKNTEKSLGGKPSQEDYSVSMV